MSKPLGRELLRCFILANKQVIANYGHFVLLNLCIIRKNHMRLFANNKEKMYICKKKEMDYNTKNFVVTISRLFYRFRPIILYGIFGSISSSLDFIIYTLLVRIVGIHYVIANCFSILCGISTSFILNRNYNFKVKDKTKQRFTMFLTIGLCGMLFSNLILWVCIEKLLLQDILSKLLSIVFVVFFQFLLNKYLTFKSYGNK
jgi:putative flippase GtrA